MSTLKIAQQIAREMRDFEYGIQCQEYLYQQIECGRIESVLTIEFAPIRKRMHELPWNDETED